MSQNPILAKSPENFGKFTQSEGFCDKLPFVKLRKLNRPPRRDHSPRVTSWDIELRAKARKLERLERSTRY